MKILMMKKLKKVIRFEFEVEQLNEDIVEENFEYDEANEEEEYESDDEEGKQRFPLCMLT